MFLAALP